jgi:hypothetical protein
MPYSTSRQVNGSGFVSTNRWVTISLGMFQRADSRLDETRLLDIIMGMNRVVVTVGSADKFAVVVQKTVYPKHYQAKKSRCSK